jgi:proteasome activator subunit 4
LVHLHEEAVNTDAYTMDTPRLEHVLQGLVEQFSPSLVDGTVLEKAMSQSAVRVAKRREAYDSTVSSAHVIKTRAY